jgi:hypothetical protein
MSKINILYRAILLLGLTACEKIVQLEIPSSDPELVVEGQITNKKDLWKIKLSTSQAYFNQDEVTEVSSATVTIMGSDGSSSTLLHTDTGMYVSTDSLQCVVGVTYTLNINYNGKEYSAAEKMPNGFPIDLIESYYLPEANGFIQEGYYVFIQGKDNDYKGDSYQWKFYRNDTLKDNFGKILENDEFGTVSFLNQNIDPDDPLGGIAQGILPRPFPFILDPGDTIRLEQYNLSPTYYQYILDLSAQLSRSGSPFDPPPTNPINNISNNGLGYFSVAHYTDAEIIIKE